MLTLTPQSLFSWDFHVERDGHEVAVIDRDWFRERATFSVHGTTYDVRRTSVLHGTFVLEQDGRVLAEAAKPRSYRRLFNITADGRSYTLQAASSFRREFHLYDADTANLLGTVRPDSMLRRNATAQFPDGMPLPVQLFVVFLVLVLWKRAADAAAGS